MYQHSIKKPLAQTGSGQSWWEGGGFVLYIFTFLGGIALIHTSQHDKEPHPVEKQMIRTRNEPAQ